jgi:histidinol-phosphate aminotransferase
MPKLARSDQLLNRLIAIGERGIWRLLPINYMLRLHFPHFASVKFMSLAKKLVASQLANLEPYQSARRIGGVGQSYLNANESPFPAFAMAAGETWNRYPDFLPTELAHRYAAYAGVEHTRVVAVRGADEGIDLLVRAFCEANKDTIRIQTPTYSMYEFVAKAHQVAVDRVPLNEEFGLDLTANLVDQDQLKLVFLCHPNNPTGNPLALDSILAIAKKFQDSAFVVVDEAYIEFCSQHSLAQLLDTYPNIIILRTLSKAFALAAVRLGFIIAHESVIAVVNTLIAPYPIPDPSAQIGLTALSKEGLAYMHKHKDQTIKLREEYAALFANVRCVKKVYPSVTNFILLEFADSKAVFTALRVQGIILRDQNHIPRLHNHLRVSIGSSAEMRSLYTALQGL